VASFIDNVIIGMETEEGHKKIVEEVVKRLVENNLYVKLKKIQVEGKESRIFRNNNRTREYQDRGGEGKGYPGLTYSIRS